MYRKPLLIVFGLCLTWFSVFNTPAPCEEAAVVEGRLRKDLAFLASEECEGRGVGTQGLEKAANYIAAQFAAAGVQPAGPNRSYFQPFTLKGNTLVGTPKLVVRGPAGQEIVLKAGEHFEPLGLANSGTVKDAELVFAGHGLTVLKDNTKEVVYDDYQGLNVAGKIVVLLRDIHRADQPRVSPFGGDRRRQASITEKLQNAEKHGALGVLLLNDRRAVSEGDFLLYFNMTATGVSGVKLPALHLKRELAEQMLFANHAQSLKQIEEDLDRELKPRSLALTGWKASLEVQTRSGIDVKNVVGVLEGQGALANETVVLGAHYDHLGYGGVSSLAGLRKPAIHRGADDNGSGSTALLELARQFSQTKAGDRRRLVLIAFTGEELGLFGSLHYCKQPIFPLKDTVAMVNLDMVGRLVPDKETKKDSLTVYGTGSAKSFDKLIEEMNKKYDFRLKKVASGSGPSDHASFFEQKIPVYFFFTGDHDDYHRPTDSAERINYVGLQKIVNLTNDTVLHLLQTKERPEYVKPPVTASAGPTPRIGIEFAEPDEKDGAVVSRVSAGGPAASAGMKEGDRIVEVDGKPVKNVQAFLASTRVDRKGSPMDVTFLRGSEKKTVKITPQRMPVLGIRPDYEEQEAKGVLLKGVAEDGPAAKAGLKAGDLIVELGGKPVTSLQEYMDALLSQKAGQPVPVGIMRGGKKIIIPVQPE